MKILFLRRPHIYNVAEGITLTVNLLYNISFSIRLVADRTVYWYFVSIARIIKRILLT
jgi:hypothetical protein